MACLETGVYQARNKVNGKVYVGSTSKMGFTARWRVHLGHLFKGTHVNKHLQASWDKYGAEAFEFTMLERALPDDCVAREQVWMDALQANDPKKGYNKRLVARSNLGLRASDETLALMSAVQKGRVKSESERANIAKSRMGKKHTQKTKAKIRSSTLLRPWPVLRQLRALRRKLA